MGNEGEKWNSHQFSGLTGLQTHLPLRKTVAPKGSSTEGTEGTAADGTRALF